MADEGTFDLKYFKLNRRLLKVAGLWPYQGTEKYVIRIVIVSMIVSVMIPLIIRLVEEYRSENSEITIIIETFNANLYFIVVLTKYFACIIFEEKVRMMSAVKIIEYISRMHNYNASFSCTLSFPSRFNELNKFLKKTYKQITEDWSSLLDEGEIEILQRHVRFGYVISVCYVVGVHQGWIVYSTVQASIPAIFDLLWPMDTPRKKYLCFPLQYYINQEEYFKYLLLQCAVGIYGTVLIGQSCDTTYFTCVQHLLALFEIAEISEMMRDAYNVCFLLETLIFFLGTGPSCYMIAEVYTKDYESTLRIRYTLFHVFTVLYQFFLCWPAQRLIDASSELSTAFYLSEWYRLPVKIQKSLIMMMQRCSRPSAITAGPILVMDFATALAVVKSGFTYMTVIATAVD